MSNERSRRGLLLVVSSPSGAGKSSLSRRLAERNPEIALSVSATTRRPRTGEVDGREYSFVSPAQFSAMVAQREFLEWAEVHENRYGTPRAPVMDALSAGRDLLFDIDWQGAAAIGRELPGDTVSVFILPPSMAALAERLRGRAQDTPDVIARRLGRARGEIEHWREYSYVIVNDDFDRAFADLEVIYRSERARRERNPWLEGFVGELMREED